VPGGTFCPHLGPAPEDRLPSDVDPSDREECLGTTRAHTRCTGSGGESVSTSRPSRWAASELPSSEDLDPNPVADALGLYTLKCEGPNYIARHGRSAHGSAAIRVCGR
jgi:hypothetical protein